MLLHPLLFDDGFDDSNLAADLWCSDREREDPDESDSHCRAGR